jgi:hypothetical protein
MSYYSKSFENNRILENSKINFLQIAVPYDMKI